MHWSAEMLECLVNGEISRFVTADDRGLAYGDGVFETLAVDKGVPRWWQDHVDRLARGCERLGLALPPQEVLLREVQTATAGQLRCVAKIIITRGSAGRGYVPPGPGRELRIVSAHAWPEGIGQAASRGIEIRVLQVRLAIQPALGGIKHLNRLEQVLAAAECERLGAAEGLLLDANGDVISGVSANLFLVSGNNLLTPRMDRCGVRGVLRARILKAFKARCELRRVSPEMLAEADELFMCSSIRGILPVVGVDDRRYPVGPVTRELQGWLADILSGA
jgi:4-amino-4-deoxychorismate lyase